ncbi:MAG: GyrI-like domain-containing protein [Neisseriaceae bacterium]
MKQIVNPFNIIGISVRTNNNDPQKLTQEMQGLWGKFMSENLLSQIPNKLNNSIYCVYTDYAGDYTGDYTAILGCQVSDLNEIPEGLLGRNFNGGDYNKYTAKGNLNNGIVYNEWKQIWNSGIARSYTADFEVYSEKAYDPINAEVDIFIAIP